jgi:hypothetical protein
MIRNDLAEVNELVLPRRWTVDAARFRGQEIVESARVAGKTYDLLKLQRSLRTLCVETKGPAMGRALALEAALAPLSIDDCAQVTIGVVCALRDEQLRDLARGALLLLRNAVSLAPVEAASASLFRLDEELERRGPLKVETFDGITLVADGLTNEVMALAMAHVLQRLSHPMQRKDTEGLVVVVTSQADRQAEDEVVLAHVRGVANRTFGSTLADELDAEKSFTGMLRLDASKVLAAAPPVQSGFRAILRDVARVVSFRRAPSRVPVALRLSVQSR